MLPKELTQLIGKAGKKRLLEVEKGAIRKYADAVGDQNPLFWDEGYASKSRFGAMIAPPGFFGWPAKWLPVGPFVDPSYMDVVDAIGEAGYSRGLFFGGAECDFYLPVRAGDVISATLRVKDIFEREGKNGKLIFLVMETTYVNQNGELVAMVCDNMIYR